MTSKQDFAKFMVTLCAAIPRFAPNAGDPGVLGVWYAELGMLDVRTLNMVYKRAVASFDAFPSIRQLLELAGCAEQSPEDKGREIAGRIYTALARGWGSLRDAETRARREAYVGPIGLEVVRLQGGWERLSDTVKEADVTTWKAQWRNLAETLARRGLDDLEYGPDAPSLPATEEFKKLAEKFSMPEAVPENLGECEGASPMERSSKNSSDPLISGRKTCRK